MQYGVALEGEGLYTCRLKNDMFQYGLARRGINKLLYLQLLVLCVIALIFYVLSGTKAAYSAVLGSLVCILPSRYFAVQLFKETGAQSAQRIVKTFYRAEAMKWLISVLLFALIFVLVDIIVVAFFMGFIGVQCVHWFTPLLFRADK